MRTQQGGSSLLTLQQTSLVRHFVSMTLPVVSIISQVFVRSRLARIHVKAGVLSGHFASSEKQININ